VEEKKGRQRSLLGGVADPESGKGERAAARQQGRSGRGQQQGREGGGAAAGGAGRRRRGRGAPAPAGRLRPRSARQQGWAASGRETKGSNEKKPIAYQRSELGDVLVGIVIHVVSMISTEAAFPTIGF